MKSPYLIRVLLGAAVGFLGGSLVAPLTNQPWLPWAAAIAGAVGTFHQGGRMRRHFPLTKGDEEPAEPEEWSEWRPEDTLPDESDGPWKV